MRYEVFLGRAAQRDLAALPTKVYEVWVGVIQHGLTENPLRLSKPLGLELTGMRVVRRGEYRMIIKVGDDRVDVLRLRHRAFAYRSD